MAVWSEVTLTEIKHGRMDSEFYKPGYIEIDRKLMSNNNIPLKGISKKIDVGHVGTMVQHYREEGVILLQTQQVDQFFLKLNNCVKITPEFHAKLKKSQVNNGDILIARSGSFGKAAIYLEEEPINSADIIIINIHESIIEKGYLLSFLNSKFGSEQLIRFASGGVQGHVNLKILEDLIIPIPDTEKQNVISEIIKKSYFQKKRSQKLYTQAQKILAQELGLDKLKFKKPVGYEANFSDAMCSSRVDAEHFYPEFDSHCHHLPDHIKFTPLSKALTYCQRGKQPQYSENGIRVINSKHVLSNKINFDDNRFAEAPLIDSLKINHGDVLINGTGRGTIGRAAAYLEKEAALPDNHVTILRTQKLDPVYLSVFLNSKAGQLQVEKFQRGSSGQIELYPMDIRKFLIWEAPESLQLEIRELHDKASSLEKESQQLLEKAKQMVEALIEQAAGVT